MKTVFLVPYPDTPGLFAVFGAETNGTTFLHVFTNELLIHATFVNLPPLSVAAEYSDVLLPLLLNLCPHTHVCLDMDFDHLVSKQAFCMSLNSSQN